QKRSENRMPMPGEWAATGGSVLSGEESRAAAIRELEEELGIRVLEHEIHYKGRLTRKNSFVDLWQVGVDADLNSLRLQTEEVQEAKWVTKEELEKMIANKQFHDYGRAYFRKVFR
ncbi:MAG: NUDIX domain-containing protein, partial [Clostridia bacterium]|nr:NUDIX domain-containing protein [Clostridia bacterium]